MQSAVAYGGVALGAQIDPCAQSTCALATTEAQERPVAPHATGGTLRLGSGVQLPPDAGAAAVMKMPAAPEHEVACATPEQAPGTSWRCEQADVAHAGTSKRSICGGGQGTCAGPHWHPQLAGGASS
jgi:hypothetical protein